MNTIFEILANIEAEAGSGKIFLEAEAFKKKCAVSESGLGNN